MIDKTAIISSDAKIGANVEIGPYAIIGEHVELGDNVKIGAHAHVEFAKIGASAVISPFASIGGLPQDLGYKNELTGVEIGEGTQIREFCTVNRASGEGNVTKVGARCLLMAYTHVAHNCVLEDEVIMANAATIGGHTHVGRGAFLGGMSVFHQNLRVGEMAIVSGASAARLDIPPYVKAEGMPALPMGINAIGLRRRNISKADRDALHTAIRILKSEQFNTTQALEEIEKTVTMNEYVVKLVEFIRTSKRGVALKSSKNFVQNETEE